MDEALKEKPVILFDGYCNFCSGAVRFIIRRDPGKVFLFAASQSEGGEKVMDLYGLNELAEHTIMLIQQGGIYQKSGAALRIAKQMRGIWPLFYGLIILPVPLRDFFYDLFAKNRYRLFGKREQCFLPGQNIRERFL